jgi:hypothetical protein
MVNNSSIISSIFSALLDFAAVKKQDHRCFSNNLRFADFTKPIAARFCCITSIQYLSSSIILIVFSNDVLAFLSQINACFLF